MEHIGVERLLQNYAYFLIDAFGVLIHAQGAVPGAAAFVDALHVSGKPYCILSNDASRLPSALSHRLQTAGLAIPAERIVTSGMLIDAYLRAHRLNGARCVVLGPEDSSRYVAAAGGVVVSAQSDFEVLVICDEAGFPFLETLDLVISRLYRKLDQRETVHLLLPNPDLVFTKSEHFYAFTSGSIAVLIEAALDLRYAPHHLYRFVRLGKPHAAIFQMGLQQNGARPAVMIGDQLQTDIRGANDAGIDSALVLTGVTKGLRDDTPVQLCPRYILPSLAP